MIRALLGNALKCILPVRGQDKWGSGAFKAPRGDRKHAGTDFSAYPGTQILSPRVGKVLRLGYAYKAGPGGVSDKAPYQLVEIRHDNGMTAKYLYLLPTVKAGEAIEAGQVIGVVQDLDLRFQGITQHVHVEVRNQAGELVDPTKLQEN